MNAHPGDRPARSARSGMRDAHLQGMRATPRLVKALLQGGVLSSLLYVTADLVVSSAYEGYSYADQTISELSAIGAPTRPSWIALSVLLATLSAAFAWGVWLVSTPTRG